MKISVVTPTCFRPQMFAEMCSSLEATTQDYDVEHIIIIDEDKETYGVVGEIAKLSKFKYVVAFNSTKTGALNAWNQGLRLSQGEIIVPGGDDHLYHPKWLDFAIESLNEKLNGYGMVGMNDLAYNEEQVATMWLFTRDYCKDHMGGVFAPPCYDYLSVDLEWEGKAKMTGHYYRDMRAKIEHRHSAHGKRPFDGHDKIKTERMVNKDTATFLSRKARGFPVEWDSLI